MEGNGAELTAEQVAERLGVGVVTVYRYLRRGELRGYRLGRKSGWKVQEDDLRHFIAAHMNKAPTWREDGDKETAADSGTANRREGERVNTPLNE